MKFSLFLDVLEPLPTFVVKGTVLDGAKICKIVFTLLQNDMYLVRSVFSFVANEMFCFISSCSLRVFSY